MKARTRLFPLVLAVAAQSAQATPTLSAALTPEAPGATGSGNVALVYDPAANNLAIDASFSGLSGTTTVAHIHCCTATAGSGTIGVAVTPGTLPGFPVGVSSGTYGYTVDLSSSASFTGAFLALGGGTAAGAEALLIAGLNAGTAYFNVHTSTFGGGEIRGFPSPVPEPGHVGTPRRARAPRSPSRAVPRARTWASEAAMTALFAAGLGAADPFKPRCRVSLGVRDDADHAV